MLSHRSGRWSRPPPFERVLADPARHLRRLTSLHTRARAQAYVAAAATLFALVPRRLGALLPVILLCPDGRLGQREPQSRRRRAPKLRVSARCDGGSTTARTGGCMSMTARCGGTLWNVFWNRRIGRSTTCGALRALCPRSLDVRSTGELRPLGNSSPMRFAVAPVNYAFVEQVASAPQFGTNRRGLGLWKIDPPLRLSTVRPASSRTACRSRRRVERLRLPFGRVRCGDAGQAAANSSGRDRRTACAAVEFATPTTSHLQYPIHVSARKRQICRLRLRPGGLLGTTRFAFVAITTGSTRGRPRAARSAGESGVTEDELEHVVNDPSNR